MAFFTRVNTNVPFLPPKHCLSEDITSKRTETKCQIQIENMRNMKDESKLPESPTTSKDAVRYDYVVDRELGVEV